MNNKNKNIYMMGIKGFGMSALAIIYKSLGCIVWGSDVDEIFPTDVSLKENGIRVVSGFKKENILASIDLLVYTGAHGGETNIEVKQAKEMGIPIMSHAQALGEIMENYHTRISVCGAHGKTTTSAILAYVLHELDIPGGYLVGAPSFSGMFAGGHTGTEIFVAEADEYATSPLTNKTPRFMYQNPDLVLCTNIELDHVDIYGSLEEITGAYKSFFKKLNADGILVYCEDNHNIRTVAKKLRLPKKISYGQSVEAKYCVSEIVQEGMLTKFKLSLKGDNEAFSIQIPGLHNVLNASGAIATLHTLGLYNHLVPGILANFQGATRRFQVIYTHANGATVVDDYAHHPQELKALIRGARERFGERKVILIFQTHTFSRTQIFLDEFARELSRADCALVLDIFSSAREKENNYKIHASDIVNRARKFGGKNVHYIDDDIYSYLAGYVNRGDIVITAGAGNVYQYHKKIIDYVRSVNENT